LTRAESRAALPYHSCDWFATSWVRWGSDATADAQRRVAEGNMLASAAGCEVRGGGGGRGEGQWATL
jgi:hypothetical protein